MRDEWYWCLSHQRAEREDEACPADRRLGPYPSADAAEHWRERHDEREATWEADDRAWEGEDD